MEGGAPGFDHSMTCYLPMILYGEVLDFGSRSMWLERPL